MAAMHQQAPTVAGNSGKSCICGLFKRKPHVDNSDRGKEFVPVLNRMVSYSITRPSTENKAKRAPVANEPCLLTSLGQASDGKVHVTWNVKTAEVHASLRDISTDQQDPTKDVNVEQRPDANDGGETETNGGGDTTALNSLAMAAEKVSPRGDEMADTALQAAYADGQAIEYYSPTQQRWMSGFIKNQVSYLGGSSNKQMICQSVILSHGQQVRADVDLDAIRAPFRAGELVEFISDGRRLPAMISYEQSFTPVFPSGRGYRVIIERSKEVLEQIQPEMLRRRYCSCQFVEVYRGPHVGWQQARVAHASSADGCGTEVLGAPHVAPRPTQPRCPAPIGSSGIGLWTSVAICKIDDEECMHPELLPSYRLRAPCPGLTAL